MILASFQKRLSVILDAVAVHAPSDIVVGGFSNNWIDARCWICKEGDLDCQDHIENWNPSCGKINGSFQDPYAIPAWKWNGSPLKIGDRIEIEKFSKPTFVTCGDKDKVWESDRTRRIEATMRKAGLNPEIHVFPNEGHGFTTDAEQVRRSMLEQFFKRSLK